jgi:hypothetical protein
MFENIRRDWKNASKNSLVAPEWRSDAAILNANQADVKIGPKVLKLPFVLLKDLK